MHFVKFLVVKHGESIVVFAKMPVDALDKRSEGRGFVFFTIFLSHSKNRFFDDFLQFHGRNIFKFPFLVTGVKIFFENFHVVQGFFFVFSFSSFSVNSLTSSSLMDANLLAMLLF